MTKMKISTLLQNFTTAQKAAPKYSNEGDVTPRSWQTLTAFARRAGVYSILEYGVRAKS